MWKKTFLAIVAGIWVVLILGIFLDESVIKWKTSELEKGSEVKSWIIDNGISKMNQRDFFPRDEGFVDMRRISRIKRDLSNEREKTLSGDGLDRRDPQNLWAWELKANISLKNDAEKHRKTGDLKDFRTKNVIKHKNISKNGNKVARPSLYNTDEFDLILKSKGVNKSKVELFQTWDLMKNFMNALFQNLESDPDDFSVNLQYKLKKKEPRVCSKDRDNKTEVLKGQTLNSTVSTTENVTAELADLKLAESYDVLDRESRVGFVVDANSQEQKPPYIITDSSIVPSIVSTTKDAQITTTSEALRKHTILPKELSKSSEVKDFQREPTLPERIPVTDYLGTEVTSTPKTIVSDTDSSLRIVSTTTSIAVDATGLSAKTSSDSSGTTDTTSLSTSDEKFSTKVVTDTMLFSTNAETVSAVKVGPDSKSLSAETFSTVAGIADLKNISASAETASNITGFFADTTGYLTSAETASATGLLTNAITASTTKVVADIASLSTSPERLSTMSVVTADTKDISTSAETVSTMKVVTADTESLIAETFSAATPMAVDLSGFPTGAETASIKVVTGGTKNFSKRADTFETTYLPWITRTVLTTLNDQGVNVSETFRTFSEKTNIPYTTEVVGRRILRVDETSSPVMELFAEDTRLSDTTETYETAIPSKPTKLLTAHSITELTDFSGDAKSSTDLEKVETEEASYSAISDIPKSITISTKEYIGDKTADKIALFTYTHLATDVEVKPSSSLSSSISSGELLADLTTVSSFDRSVIAGLEESPEISPRRNFSMIIGKDISLFTSSSVSDEILEKVKNASLLARVIFTPDLEPTKVSSTQQTLETFDLGSTETPTVVSLSSVLVDVIPADLKGAAADRKVLSSTPNISCSTLLACTSELQNLLMRNVGDIKNNYIILIVLNNSVVYGNILPGGVSEIMKQIPSNLNMKEVLNKVKNITTIGSQSENINKLVLLTKTQRISSLNEKRVDSDVETARIRNCSKNETVGVKRGTSLVEENGSFTTTSIDHVEHVPKAMRTMSGIEESIKLLPTEHNQSYFNFLSTSYIDHNTTGLGVNLEPAENVTEESSESENFLNVWNKIKDIFKDSLIIEIKPQTKPFITKSLNISPTSRQNISTISPRPLDVDSISSGSFIPWISERFTKDLSFEMGSKSSDFWSERDLSEFSTGSPSEPGISLLRESETMQNDSLWIGSEDESSGDLLIGSGAEWSDKFWTGNELSKLSIEMEKEPTEIFETGSEITKVPYLPSTTQLWSEEIFDIENKLNTTQLEDLTRIKSLETTNVLQMKTIGEYKSEATIMKMNSTTLAVSETEQPHTLSADRTFVANLTPNGKPKVVTLLGFDIPVFQPDENDINVTGKSMLNADFTAKVSRERMDNLTSSSISSNIKLLFTPTSKLTIGSDERVTISKPVITEIKQNITRHPASLKMAHETTHGRKDWTPHFKFDKIVGETTRSVNERTLSTSDQRKHLTPSFKRKTSLKDYTSIPKPDAAHVPITPAENHTLSVLRSAEAPELSLQRFCTSIQHCNASLKERCVSKDTHSICECGSAFARNPQTSVCQEKIPIMASLKIPNEEFATGLDNPASVIHQRKKRDAEQTMWSVVQLSDSLQKLVSHVIVDSFSAGSVVLNIQMILAGLHQDMSPEELETFVGREIEDVLNNKIHLMQGALLNLENAILLSISSGINPCQYEELNYCSKNADCLPDTSKAGGFRCVCREKYTDNSPDDDYPGEVCIAICPNNYCRNNGHCRVGSDDDFYCSCAEWYVGERCEIPGLAIIGAVAAIAFVLLVVLAVILVYTIYKRSRPHRRVQHQFRGVSGKRRSVQWNQKTLWPGIIPTDDEHVIPARYQSIARSPLVFEDSLTLPV